MVLQSGDWRHRVTSISARRSETKLAYRKGLVGRAARVPPDPPQARGYARGDCIAVGDSREDLGVIDLVSRFFLVANAPEDDPRAERTEASYGEGFYEAVVRSLAERR